MKTHDTINSAARIFRAGAFCLAFAGLISAAHAQAVLINQWMLDNNTTGYVDLIGGKNMSQNAGTTTAFQVSGSPVNTTAMELGWADPGPATQLYSSAGQTGNSFGFSFWVNPVFLSTYNNFIGKQTTVTNRADWGSLAWQVHLLGDDAGYSKLEFIVRGDSTGSDFFGAVSTTSTVFKLNGDQPDTWVNVAGGYDNSTGALSLYVGGTQYTASGTAGASVDSTAPFFAGTGFNDAFVSPVTYSAGTRMWDLRLYDSPLNQTEVNNIIAAVPEPQTWVLLAMGLSAVGLAVRGRLGRARK